VCTDVSCRCSNAMEPETNGERKKPDLLLYHQLWHALFRGDNDIRHRRPPLPIELVDVISKLAGFCVLDSTRTFEYTIPIDVYTRGPFEAKLWFCTQPFDSRASKQIAAMQLLTCSNDQGWQSDPLEGSNTWFEWGMFPSLDEVTCLEKSARGADGWRMSHKNISAEETPQNLEVPILAADDSMLKDITEGCVVAVRACAMLPLWHNHCYRAQLRFWKWFQPVVQIA
jgi:hypothetical protein